MPIFTPIEPYRSPDGQTEIDALAENGERWAVEGFSEVLRYELKPGGDRPALLQLHLWLCKYPFARFKAGFQCTRLLALLPLN